MNYYCYTFVLIFFLCSFFLYFYISKVNKNLIIVSKDYLRKNFYNHITSVSSNVSNNIDLSNIMDINKNDNGEILFVKYNLSKCYEVLNKISKLINENLLLNEIVLKEPLFISSSYIALANLGPKIPIKIRYINMSLSNIYTKITNYGLNNALVEIYVTININGRIITPVNNTDENIKYDMLISSMIINGRVPSFYGSTITANSNIFDIGISI